MCRSIIAAIALSFVFGAAGAQQREKTGSGAKLASAQEVAKVKEAIGRINCKADVVEKEGASLFEVDDAQCEIGQYDIKLDGDFNIIVMTRDTL